VNVKEYGGVIEDRRSRGGKKGCKWERGRERSVLRSEEEENENKE
jgi:hypothetical protein